MPKLEMTNRDDILAHWGTEGMRWGERRYQNYDGSLTEEGRRHYGIGKPRMSKAEKLNLKKKKQQEKNLKKARNAKKKQAKQEQKAVKDAENLLKKKQKIYERGDAAEIYKNRKLFTTEEYQKAIQRAETFSKSKPQKEVKPAKVDDGKMHSFQLSISGTKGSSDAAKQKIINSGDAKLVKKNLSKLNDQELRSAIEHIKGKAELDKSIKSNKDLKALEKAQKDRDTTKNGKDIVDRLIGVGQTAGKVGAAAVSAYTGYNQFASMVNEITGEKKFPVYNMKPWESKKDDKKSDKGGKSGPDIYNQIQKKADKNNPVSGAFTESVFSTAGDVSFQGLSSGGYSTISQRNMPFDFGSSNSYSSDAKMFSNVLYEASSTPIDSISWMLDDFDA